MMVLNSGYRNPLTYSDEILTRQKRALTAAFRLNLLYPAPLVHLRLRRID